jgi:hypothetical protein
VRRHPRLTGKEAPSCPGVEVCGAGGGWCIPTRSGPMAACSGAILEVRYSDGDAGSE